MTRWFVVHTRANEEQRALGHLQRQGFTAYLPQCRRWRRHARRRELVRRPLFPRYLFVALDLESARWRPILSTVGVAGLVQHGERPTPVPEGVVEELRACEAAGEFDVTHSAARLRLGDVVRITSGPFADLIGKFSGMADRERVFVLLDLLGRHAKTAVPATAVAPA